MVFCCMNLVLVLTIGRHGKLRQILTYLCLETIDKTFVRWYTINKYVKKLVYSIPLNGKRGKCEAASSYDYCCRLPGGENNR